MSSALRWRRDPSSIIATATGLLGEVFFDTTRNTLVCQDGATPGGFPLAHFSDVTNQWISSGVTPSFISSNSFSLAGNQAAEFHVGRRSQFMTTAGPVYGTITASVFTTLTTVTMQMDGTQVLDSGLSITNLSILRADHFAVSGVLIKRTIITAAGVSTFTKQPGTNLLEVQVQAGGGAGAGSQSTGVGLSSVSGSGAAGGFRRKRIVSPAATYTNGGTGGASSFGIVVSAVGGTGGQPSAASSNVISGRGGSGGGGAGGDISIDGQDGGWGWSLGTPGFGATGAGGSSALGLGAASAASASNILSIAGTGYGAGSAGSFQGSGSPGVGSQPGQPGIIIIEEYS
jgi:hypothetical protein